MDTESADIGGCLFISYSPTLACDQTGFASLGSILSLIWENRNFLPGMQLTFSVREEHIHFHGTVLATS